MSCETVFLAGEASGDAYAGALLQKILLLVRARPAESELDFVKRHIQDVLGPDPDNVEQQQDSLATVEIVMALEEKFGFEIPDDVQPGLISFGGIQKYVGSRLLVEWPDEILVQAMGGRRVREAGAKLVADTSTWGAIGIAESLRVYPKARAGLSRARKALAKGEPGVFVPIDYGYLNIGLARYAKQLGWKVVYFSPPGAWRKDKQGEDLPKVTDAVITPFSWSAEILNKMGAQAHWFGHPIKQMIRDGTTNDKRQTTNDKRERINDKLEADDRGSVAILPGSRRSEVDLLLPVFAEALKGISERAEFAVASSLDRSALREKWRGLAPGRDDLFTSGDTYGVLRRARAAIVCSGTATLEAALCGCPHLVVYKVSQLVELQARLIRFKVTHIAQPNILLGREVVPELIQHGATSEAVAQELRMLLDDEECRAKQLDAFSELDVLLGPDDAVDKSAELIAGMLESGK